MVLGPRGSRCMFFVQAVPVRASWIRGWAPDTCLQVPLVGLAAGGGPGFLLPDEDMQCWVLQITGVSWNTLSLFPPLRTFCPERFCQGLLATTPIQGCQGPIHHDRQWLVRRVHTHRPHYLKPLIQIMSNMNPPLEQCVYNRVIFSPSKSPASNKTDPGSVIIISPDH